MEAADDLRSLGCKAASAAAPLAELLGNPSPQVRLSAAAALLQIKSKEARAGSADEGPGEHRSGRASRRGGGHWLGRPRGCPAGRQVGAAAEGSGRGDTDHRLAGHRYARAGRRSSGRRRHAAVGRSRAGDRCRGCPGPHRPGGTSRPETVGGDALVRSAGRPLGGRAGHVADWRRGGPSGRRFHGSAPCAARRSWRATT